MITIQLVWEVFFEEQKCKFGDFLCEHMTSELDQWTGCDFIKLCNQVGYTVYTYIKGITTQQSTFFQSH